MSYVIVKKKSKKKKELFSSMLLTKEAESPKEKNKKVSSKRKSTSLSPVKILNEILNPHAYRGKKIKEKTLVIDLDETLVHSSFEPNESADVMLQVDFDDNNQNCDIYLSIRPGAREFIKSLSNYYEIIIFTASNSKYAEPVMNLLDDKNIIDKKLFRENCTFKEGVYIKDLTQMGKDLRNVVLIDNNVVSFAFQNENGIPIKSWFDDYNDIELFKLVPILKNLSGFYDVRTEIKKFVSNNTFIWMKGINWLKENLLNINFYNDLVKVMERERNAKTIETIDVTRDNSLFNDINETHRNTDEFIKITNNFFYETIGNIKIVDGESECDEEDTYGRVLTEVGEKREVLKKSVSTSNKKKEGNLSRTRFSNTTSNSNSITATSSKKSSFLGNVIANMKSKIVLNKDKIKELKMQPGYKKVSHHFPSYSINFFNVKKTHPKKKKNVINDLLNTTK